MRKFRGNPESKQFEATSGRSLASLNRALHADEQEPLTCAECRQHFAALHHKQHTETPLTALEQASVRHLTTCPDCAAEFEALQTAMHAMASGTLPELSQPYEFDLSFLTPPASSEASPATSLSKMPQKSPPPSVAQLWANTLGSKLWSLIDEIQIGFQAGRATFASFPSTLTPALTSGAVMRSAGNASGDTAGNTAGDNNQVEELVLPAPDAAFSLHLAVGPLIAGKAVVTVKLVNPANAQPLQNTLVALRNSQRQLLLGCTSGEDGYAILEPLARGRYFIQVQLNHQTWEVPLAIVDGSPLD